MHDFSAAGWLFCSLLLWQIMPAAKREAPVDIVVKIVRRIRLFMQLSLAGIIVFGIVRMMAYRQYEWNTEAGEGQVVLLAVKHIVFAAIFVCGLISYFRAGKWVQKILNDSEE